MSEVKSDIEIARAAKMEPIGKVLAKITDDKTVYIARGIVYYDMGNY